MGKRLFQNLENFGNDVAAISDNGMAYSYAQLVNRADEIARPIEGRCLVALICENSVECLAAYVGLLRAGAALLLLHRSITTEQLEAILERFQPKYTCASVNGAYALQRTPYMSDYPLHDDLCLLLTTSGTTGSRSFVRQSYMNIISNVDSITQYLRITSADRAITTMPMSYTYGLSIINSHLMSGASLVMTEASLMSPLFWPLLKNHQVTNFGGVPFIYEMLKKLRFETLDLGYLRHITQAGGRLRPELVSEFAAICKQKGVEFFVMYGQTEATARMAYLSPEFAAKKPESIGVAIPGGSFSLIDDDGNIIDKPNTPGELVYSGLNVTMGYANGYADLAKGDENKGVLRTGDIAVRDRVDLYTIVGRKKRFLKVFGNRVSLDEVESILNNAGYICACGGEDDKLVIYVSGSIELEKIKSAMSKSTSLTPQGYRIVHVAEIPHSESGKIDYVRLKTLSGE